MRNIVNLGLKKNTNNSNIKGCPRDIYGRKFIIKLLKRYYI